MIKNNKKVQGVHITIIGGGTGPFTINQALKSYAFVSAIPGMWDDGGSTGILRDEMGVLPPGDARQALVSLADNETMRTFFNHRLQKGAYENHAIGNLFLSGLEELTGSFAKAVETAGELLKIRGEVIPVTTDKVHLCLRQKNGEIIRGEHHLDEAAGKNYFEKGIRPDLFLDPEASINPNAKYAIEHSDLVVFCPGTLYTSVGPHFLVKGMVEALKNSKAKKVYVSNLMTIQGQTDNFKVIDHVDALEALANQPIFDYVVYNNRKPSRTLLERYGKEGETLVAFSPDDFAGKPYEAIGATLISDMIYKQNPNDKLDRTLIRHNGDTVARLLMSIAFKPK
jgi:uncharacterized cofD-like protein